MAAPKNIDWFALRKEYLEDARLTYADIAAKHGVSLTVVKDRGAKEDWQKLRQSITAKALQHLAATLAKNKASANERHLQQYRNLQGLSNRRINQISESKADIEAQEIRALAQALKMATDGERIVLGLPTTVSSFADNEGRTLEPIQVVAIKSRKNADQQEARSNSGDS